VPPDVSAVVVNHQSVAECADCVRSLREEFSRGGIHGEVLVVDCASGPAEVERLAGLAPDALLALPENRGYSGGLNAGLARARGPRLLLCNADVVFLPGAVPKLLESADAPGVGAAAPLACWDAEGLLYLPAGDPPGFLSELVRGAAARSPAIERRQFASFARRTIRLWRAGGRTQQLVGAVLAARREVFDRAGRFDERFAFEYEETEWEDRVRRRGFELRFVPQARVRHLWAVSASRNPDSSRRREESRRRYREGRFGRLGRRLLDRAGRAPRRPAAAPIAHPELAARPGAWLAISPNASCIPFAGTPLSRDFRLPAEVAASLRPGTWYLRAFSEQDGRPLETFAWEKRP